MIHGTVTRSSGILLHPTGLPGPFGIGDAGPRAFEWIEALAEARQSWWQVLPLGPTGYGDSPYQALSSFAGNPNLISPTLLFADGWVARGDEAGCFLPENGGVHFQEVARRKRDLLLRAREHFRDDGAYEQFRAANRYWLDDFAQFAAIKQRFEEKPWWEWPPRLARRDPAALRDVASELKDEIDAHRFAQFVFEKQWSALRSEARRKGVRLIGDLPFYTAEDSADVWANPALFLQDASGRPRLVGGVPPDYFSTTGQLWGNPVYDWEEHARTRYRWWTDRVRSTLSKVDVVRLDHFRGIESYWAVPFGEPTAERGAWLPGPGAALLDAIRTELGGLPIIAEDLGVITPAVEQLRAQFQLPGMCVLQFAFGGAVESRFLPHRHERETVVYTGTHDNDTTAGWAAALTEADLRRFVSYEPGAARNPVSALLRLAWASVADLAIAPMQDVLGLGSAARFNTPGTRTGNWAWRLSESAFGSTAWRQQLAELTSVYERVATA
ncbi:MAG: 4-alpha-glucanotransferase [Gemmataceae bacterium]